MCILSVGGGDGNLDAKFKERVCVAFADSLNLERVQGIANTSDNLLPRAHPPIRGLIKDS